MMQTVLHVKVVATEWQLVQDTSAYTFKDAHWILLKRVWTKQRYEEIKRYRSNYSKMKWFSASLKEIKIVNIIFKDIFWPLIHFTRYM